MTEADWLAFDDPVEMLKDIGRRLTVRKGRLVACALCRRIWDRLEPTSRDAAEMAERYADRGVTKRAVAAARPAILKPAQDIREYWRRSAALSCFQAFEELADVAAWGAARGVMGAISGNADTRDSWAHERKLQVALVRDILDNPFRPRPQLPAPAPHVRGLAQAAYDERALPSGHLDPARLAVLSDALEEAGCTDADILTHLRSPSPHVRGCWALDLVLARG